jgi:hypothetical protein
VGIARMKTKAVILHEKFGHIEEIELDLTPHVNEAHILLMRHPTFIGQWSEIDVVVMKSEIGTIHNENKLPKPFDGEDVLGPILLVRMDEDSEPQDFTLREYNGFISSV